MALLNRDEFATLCGKTTNYINTYIVRKKIRTLPENKKLIDSEDPLNILFRKNLNKIDAKITEARRAEKRAKKITPPPAAQKEVQNDIEGVSEMKKEIEDLYGKVVELARSPITDIPTKNNSKSEEQEDEENDWALRKIIADTLKAEKQAEKEALAVEKMMGRLMPTDMVQQIIAVNIGHIYKSLENELINIGGTFCDILADGDRGKLGEIVAKVRETLHRIVKDTEITALKEVENVIDEYSESRNRGERK